MKSPFGAFGSAQRWALGATVIVLLSIAASVAWARAARAQAVSAWRGAADARGMRMRIGSTEGLGAGTLRDLELEVSPQVLVRAARVELGRVPWQRVSQAHEVVVSLRGPLVTVWEQVHGLAWPTDLHAADVRVEYTDPSRSQLVAEHVTFEPSTDGASFQIGVLHALGTTFRNVHVWARRHDQTFELRLARETADSPAFELRVTQSRGEGVEWSLDIPSQRFSQWARRIALTGDETWAEAVVVGRGALIVPESPAVPARATLRFTVDRWHRPSWPDAALLTGSSGAIALRITPSTGGTHRVSRVEVEAGLFSLGGSGELSFGELSHLTFDAHGRQTCVRLLDHLPPSSIRERIRAHLREHPDDATNGASVRLDLTVRAEAPEGAPLKFRWHLHAGCGLEEMTE